MPTILDLEQTISGLIRAVLAEVPGGARIPDSEEFRRVLGYLERYLPALLGEIYPEWNWEGLDGVIPIAAHKTAKGEVELLGLCIIMSDQTLTPFLLCLQIATSRDEVSWLELRLGEHGRQGMVRTPYQSREAATKRLYALDGSASLVEWVYKVTFGQRQA